MVSRKVPSGDTFPLPWEQVLWSAPPYAFTDFRLVVRRRGRTVDELALDDIDSVALSQTRWQRITGTTTVRVVSRRNGRTLDLVNTHQGPQLALLLQLRATELLGDDSGDIDADCFRRVLGPESPSSLRPHRGLLAATAAFALFFVGVGLARHEPLPPVIYSADDPIAPHGQRRSTEEIVTFMERDVMPFARRAFAPLVVGADEVTCETCHGQDAALRNWKMPGVRALPEPELRFAGLEHARIWLDPQMRNAVYGYLAEENK